MDEKRKIANEIKEKMLFEAISAISIKAVEEKWAYDNSTCSLYIKTSALDGVDAEALNEAKAKLSTKDFEIDWLIAEENPKGKNTDTVTIHIVSTAPTTQEIDRLVY